MKVYEIKVFSDQLPSPLWRKLLIPEDYSFYDLHCILQMAFGYKDQHSHEFLIEKSKTRITNDSDLLSRAKFLNSEEGEDYLAQASKREDVDLSVTVLDSKEAYLSEVFPFIDSLVYLYDFEDQWVYQIEVEGDMENAIGDLPRIVEGLGTAAFEDCGGVEGYLEIMDVVTQERGTYANTMRDWLEDQGYHIFDKEEANEDMKAFEEKRQRE